MKGELGKKNQRLQHRSKFLVSLSGVLEPKSSTGGVPHLYRSGPALVLLGLVIGWE